MLYLLEKYVMFIAILYWRLYWAGDFAPAPRGSLHSSQYFSLEGHNAVYVFAEFKIFGANYFEFLTMVKLSRSGGVGARRREDQLLKVGSPRSSPAACACCSVIHVFVKMYLCICQNVFVKCFQQSSYGRPVVEKQHLLRWISKYWSKDMRKNK